MKTLSGFAKLSNIAQQHSFKNFLFVDLETTIPRD
jgi:hypothetical protein